VPPAWTRKPAKLRHKDRDARWTVKFTKAKPREDGTVPNLDLAIPAFGYRNHISIDRRHGLIRHWTTTDAAAHEGARLGELIDAENTASDLWGDTAYRSAKNEALLAQRGLVSRIHRKSRKAGRWPRAPDGRMHASQRCVRGSSMCSPTRRRSWD
jgi:transposase, IS5 family